MEEIEGEILPLAICSFYFYLVIQKEEKEKVVKVDKDKGIRTILEVDRKRPWSKLGIGVVWKDSGSEVAFKETLRYELMN